MLSLRYLVHGSLARAGKVKGRTPKVDKQEKKKTPKGRAKKRILYNRRFVLSPMVFSDPGAYTLDSIQIRERHDATRRQEEDVRPLLHPKNRFSFPFLCAPARISPNPSG